MRPTAWQVVEGIALAVGLYLFMVALVLFAAPQP